MLKNNHTPTLVYDDKDIYQHLEYMDRIRNGILDTYVGAHHLKSYPSAGISMNYFEIERDHGFHISMNEENWKLKIDIILEP